MLKIQIIKKIFFVTKRSKDENFTERLDNEAFFINENLSGFIFNTELQEKKFFPIQKTVYLIEKDMVDRTVRESNYVCISAQSILNANRKPKIVD